MFPSVILNFVGIFATILLFIFALVATINVFQAKEVDPQAKQQALILLAVVFVSLSKTKFIRNFWWFIEGVIPLALLILILNGSVPWSISVLVWHFTAVECSLCSMIEDEEADAELRQPDGAAYQESDQYDRKSVR